MSLLQTLLRLVANLSACAHSPSCEDGPLLEGNRPSRAGITNPVARHGTIVGNFAIEKRNLYANANSILLGSSDQEVAMFWPACGKISPLLLCYAGRISLNDTFATHLPELEGNSQGNIIAINRLTHSGCLLPLYIPDFRLADSYDSYRRAC